MRSRRLHRKIPRRPHLCDVEVILVVMGRPTSAGTAGASDGDAAESRLDAVSDEVLVARVSSARKTGNEDPRDVEELLRRAATQNAAALDRLAH